MRSGTQLLALTLLCALAGKSWGQFGRPIPIPRFVPAPRVPVGGGIHPHIPHVGGHGGKGDGDWVVPALWLGGGGGAVLLLAFLRNRRKRLEEQEAKSASSPPDRVFSAAEVAGRVERTEQALSELARVHAALDIGVLKSWIRSTFLLAQQSRGLRDDTDIRPRLGAALARKHRGQLDELRQRHLLNRLDRLEVLRLELVQVQGRPDIEDYRVAALITFKACVSYRDDRLPAVSQGSGVPATFQELWTFRYQDGTWLLEDIAYTPQLDELSEERLAKV